MALDALQKGARELLAGGLAGLQVLRHLGERLLMYSHDSFPTSICFFEALSKPSRAKAGRYAACGVPRGEQPERTFGVREDCEPKRNKVMPSAAGFARASFDDFRYQVESRLRLRGVLLVAVAVH